MNKKNLYTMMRIMTSAVLLFVFIIMQNGYSQSCDCGKALEKDITHSSADIYAERHYFNLVNEGNYTYRKTETSKNLDISGSYGAYAGALKDSKDYKDFDIKRRDYFNQTSWSSTESASYKYFETATSNAGYNAFSYCLSICNKKPGVYLQILDEEECGITIKLFYFSGDGNPPLIIRPGGLQIQNGTIEGTNLLMKGDTIQNNGEVTFFVSRTNIAKKVHVIVNATVLGTQKNASLKIDPLYEWIQNESVKITRDVVVETNTPCNFANCLDIQNPIAVEILEFQAPERTTLVNTEQNCSKPGFIARKDDGNPKRFDSLGFGEWENRTCKTETNFFIEGKGWHCDLGDCCFGDSKVGPVSWVKLRVTYLQAQDPVKQPKKCE